eukprot:CAMPEP_0117036598 /NCGR_PEP_ID=MMETSP0472-20121206/25910_1 /TAXON_ID=693140 ORGANISM="Tiarina fusus, Strain LIS" /NCGR_SAMPLE_ID=MMETSP0472 /ASSEMBLY_ACC=CAM_ASM_000603 /LENGTH=181 /DNA_ID=CAMNT_0004746391 /DNA_START=22 /DNA_END=567 /DNA_ORIENTATION=-
MPINLSKGQTINLSKINLEKKETPIDFLHVGLGWDVNQRAGAAFDLDAMAYCKNTAGKWDKDYSCNYSQLDTPGGAIHHCGDNLTGAGEGDDEVMQVRLSKLPAHISTVRFQVAIYDAKKRNQTFGQVQNAFIRLVNLNNNQELCRYTLSNEFSSFGTVAMAEVNRTSDGWNFVALGKGIS